jgi:hypothetical protein
MSASFSIDVIPAASSFSIVLGPTPASSVSGVPGRRKRGHLRFDFAALFFLALDVDVPADQLAGQPHVLALLADRERQLRIFDDHFEALFFRVDDLHARDFRGAQRLLRERDGSSLYGMMSIFSPRSSRMMDCTRMPFMPTHAPTGSTSLSRLSTAILVRSPASRATARICTVPS